jgi:integrase
MVFYVRVGHGPRIRIKAVFDTPEFYAEYEAAISGNAPPRKTGPTAGSLAWLIERYREVDAWASLSPATRRQRENIFKQIIASAGDKPYTAITDDAIAAGRDRRSRTPFQARHFLDTMRGLFEWAKERKFIKVDPAATVKYPKLKSGPGFPIWSEDDVVAYEQRWPLGTRQRVWISVLLYTGLRRGDAVRLGKQHVRDGVASIKTEKTDTDVHIPLLPPLIEALGAGPTADLAFICGSNGKPMTKESFGNSFKDACRAAGINKSAHGLRKIGATRCADNGATGSELNALFGWTGTKMASLYTQNADRKRLARTAVGKLLNDKRTNNPAHEQKLREKRRKRQ